MDFSKKSSSHIQRKMADSIQGKNRRNQVLNYLAIENGDSILDLGCGGGHLAQGHTAALQTAAASGQRARLHHPGLARQHPGQGVGVA